MFSYNSQVTVTMIKRRVLLITLGISTIGIVPKFLKNAYIDWQLGTLYFFYIGFCFLSFYVINAFLWTSKPNLSPWKKWSIGLVCGFIMLTCFHLLVLPMQPKWLLYFLNLKENSFARVILTTAFRALIIQSVAFASLFFLKSKEEQMVFQQKIDHLNAYLNDLRNNLTEQKPYKNTIITRFQDKVMPIEISEIAFFHVAKGIVYQYLFSNQNYIQNDTLERFESDLDPTIFFRANRQFLIHRKAVEKVAQIDHRKLKVTLILPTPETIIISKAKSSAFIKWLETV